MRDASAAVLVVLLLLSAAASAGEVATDDATGLIVDDGWLQVRAHCGGCHSFALLTSQRADRQTWLDLIRWMQATQNLWQLAPATESAILDYLAKNYPPRQERRRAPLPASLLPPVKNGRVSD